MSALPYRVPAPPEPERGPDPEELAYARRLRRLAAQGRFRFAAFVLALVAALFLVSLKVPRRAQHVIVPVEHAEKTAAARAAIEQARSEARAAQALFAKAIAASRGDEVGCDLDLSPALTKSRRNLPLAVVTAEDVAAGNVTSPYLTSLFADAARAEATLAHGHATEIPRRAPARDFVVVADKLVAPHATGPTSYEPGSIDGRAYVYDFASAKVLCSTRIHAKSSTEIAYAYGRSQDARENAPALGRSAGLQASLDDDLRFEIERAIVQSFGRHSSL